jgi:hypothetical protein
MGLGSSSFVRSDLFGVVGKLFGLMAATLFAIGFGASQGWAGDASASSSDFLSVNTPANTLLPQSQSSESDWLSGLHVSGYAAQTFGMW